MPDFVQRVIALLLAIATAPVMVILAILIRLDTPGPILYRSVRVGMDGRSFECLKLRTMRWDPHGSGSAITVAHDRRVTKAGALLRGARLDELPQLWNVVLGQMRLVGPRPEDPRFVDMRDELHREVFSAPPGVTGLTQIVFADEARLLRDRDGDDVYRSVLLPRKLMIDLAYLRARSTRLDLRIVIWTLGMVVGHHPSRAAITALVGNDSWQWPPPLPAPDPPDQG